MAGKVNNRGMREVNRALVLDLIRRAKQTSRSEVARLSKLTKPTVGAIVEELLAHGVIREVGPDTSSAGVGRKARLLQLNGASAAYLGVQFGVGTLEVAVANALGETIHVEQSKVGRRKPEQVISSLKEVVRLALRAAKVPKSRVRAAGAVLPGLVDHSTGECVLAPNLGWEDLPIRKLVKQQLGVPVSVHNITQAAALAERRVGVARDLASFAWVYVGSGVGAAFVLNGSLYLGRSGFSGEIGHCRVERNGVLCRCGHHGCLETLVAAPGLIRTFEQRRGDSAEGARRQPRRRDLGFLINAAKQGDEVAAGVLDDAGKHLGLGLSFLANVLNVSTFVVGGEVADAGELLLSSTQASLGENVLLPDGLRVLQSELGDAAGLRGAVFAALEHHQRAPRMVEE